MLLAVAALLPRLYWDAGPETAPALQQAGIERVAVPSSRAAAWKGAQGIAIETVNLDHAVKLSAPSVDYRANQGSASRSPWINSNGWEFLRQPAALYLYQADGPAAALSAAEAFSYRANALIQTNQAGLKPLADMLKFLAKIPAADLQPVADIGFVDDGSDDAGEVMNLMVKGNLLFRIAKGPDPSLKLNVKLGTKDYSLEEARRNPAAVAHVIRANLTDDKRSLRLYGSLVVLGRLEGDGRRLRVHLLNCAGAQRTVDGLRVRVLGQYHKYEGNGLLDYVVEADATEFTVPSLASYTVVDLSK